MPRQEPRHASPRQAIDRLQLGMLVEIEFVRQRPLRIDRGLQPIDRLAPHAIAVEHDRPRNVITLRQIVENVEDIELVAPR